MSNSNLKVLVEEKTEVGKDDPQLLPTVRVLELALEITTHLILSTQQSDHATVFVFSSVVTQG